MPNQLDSVRILLAGIAGLLVVATILLVDGDAARSGLIVIAVLIATVAALLPLLRGRLELGGLKTELREDVTEAVEEAGADKGLAADELEDLARNVADRVLAKQPKPSARAPAQAGAPALDCGYMECTECQTLAPLNNVPPPRKLNSEISTILTMPRCRKCGASTWRMPR